MVLVASIAMAQQRPGHSTDAQAPEHGPHVSDDGPASTDSDLQKLLQAQTAMLEKLNGQIEALQLRVAALEAKADAKVKR